MILTRIMLVIIIIIQSSMIIFKRDVSEFTVTILNWFCVICGIFGMIDVSIYFFLK